MDLKETLKYLKLREATISTVLGFVVVILSGIFLINYFSNRSSQTQTPIEIGDELKLYTNHTVQKGESLSLIAEKYYGNKSHSSLIASENDIENVDSITEGQTLKIPNITPTLIVTPVTSITQAPTPTTIMPSPTSIFTPSPTVVTSTGEGAISTEAKSHTVSNSENLWKIAENYYKSGYNWVDISEANNLKNPNQIESGQVIIIPNVSPKLATVKTVESPAVAGTSISESEYTVQKGDSLWNIALRSYGDGYKWSDIARENNISNPNLIFSESKLKIPR